MEIFTFPVPERLQHLAARCPACDGIGRPMGHVAARIVFRCTACGIRFKDGYSANPRQGIERP